MERLLTYCIVLHYFTKHDVQSAYDKKLLEMRNDNAKLGNKVDRNFDLLSPGVAARSATQVSARINLSEVQTSTSEVQTSANCLNVESSETTSEVETSKEAGGDP